jgi:hypothetical protein
VFFAAACSTHFSPSLPDTSHTAAFRYYIYLEADVGRGGGQLRRGLFLNNRPLISRALSAHSTGIGPMFDLPLRDVKVAPLPQAMLSPRRQVPLQRLTPCSTRSCCCCPSRATYPFTPTPSLSQALTPAVSRHQQLLPHTAAPYVSFCHRLGMRAAACCRPRNCCSAALGRCKQRVLALYAAVCAVTTLASPAHRPRLHPFTPLFPPFSRNFVCSLFPPCQPIASSTA